MTVQLEARERLARLAARPGPANADAPTAGPGGRLTRVEVLGLQALPIDKLRELAQGQFKAAQDAWEAAVETPWYYAFMGTVGVMTKGAARFLRYRAEAQQLDHAKELLEKAPKEATEADQRKAYINGFAEARMAAAGIAKQAGLGGHAYVFLVKPSVDAVKEWAQENLPSLPSAADVVIVVMVGLLLLGGGSK